MPWRRVRYIVNLVLKQIYNLLQFAKNVYMAGFLV